MPASGGLHHPVPRQLMRHLSDPRPDNARNVSRAPLDYRRAAVGSELPSFRWVLHETAD